MDRVELMRAGIGQRADQHGVEHAEDRGRRADAERERQHGNRGKAGTAQESAHGILHVTK
jgi:hypothetical protein